MGIRFGAYGKIPALGDFLRIGLASDFARGWDSWLQETILEVRRGLGARWTDCYMTMPIWRFTLAGGTLGDTQIIGVLMASVDSVGRQFPLTLAAELDVGDEVAPVAVHLASDRCFEALEALALDALEDGMQRTVMMERLAHIPPPSRPRAVWATAPGEATLCAAGDARGLSWALGAALVAQKGTTLSLWSCLHVDGRRMMTLAGLPRGELAAALFDPEHAQWARISSAGTAG